MEQKVVYTCIFSNYEALKQPNVVTPGWRYICFSDVPFKSDIWEIIYVPKEDSTRLQSRRYKALFYLYIKEEFSMYIDGSFQINCDLNEFWNDYFRKPFSCPSHPMRNCIYKEMETIIEANRGGRENVEQQVAKYVPFVKANGGLTTSGILLRQNTERCRDLCLTWYNETSNPEHSLRDQISFCKARLDFEDIIHLFDYKYNQNDRLLYYSHFNLVKDGTTYF